MTCRISGPYGAVGDVAWTCRTHDVEAVLRHPGRYGAGDLRRADFTCPVDTHPTTPAPRRDRAADQQHSNQGAP